MGVPGGFDADDVVDKQTVEHVFGDHGVPGHRVDPWFAVYRFNQALHRPYMMAVPHDEIADVIKRGHVGRQSEQVGGGVAPDLEIGPGFLNAKQRGFVVVHKPRGQINRTDKRVVGITKHQQIFIKCVGGGNLDQLLKHPVGDGVPVWPNPLVRIVRVALYWLAKYIFGDQDPGGMRCERTKQGEVATVDHEVMTSNTFDKPVHGFHQQSAPLEVRGETRRDEGEVHADSPPRQRCQRAASGRCGPAALAQ